MSGRKLFSVGDFAKISRTAESTLRYYDKVGLLEPLFRGENRYRRYSIRQLASVNVIRTLQKLGVPLSEIKALREERTPKLAKEILLRQIEYLRAKADDVAQAESLLFTLLRSIQAGLDANKEEITVQFMPAESIILGDVNDYSNGRVDYDALFSFYRAMPDRCSDWDLRYPVWGMFTQEQVRRKEWKWPARYYFYNPNGQSRKPAALYAIGYMRTGYSMGDWLFGQMTDYIDQNGFEICGDAYAEYPLNEICVTDDNQYLLRLMITVKPKEA